MRTLLLLVSFCLLICCAMTIAIRKPSITYCAFKDPSQLQIFTRSAGRTLLLDLTSGAVSVAHSQKAERVWQFANAKVHLSPCQTSSVKVVANRKWEEYEAKIFDNNGVETRVVFQFPHQPSSIEFLDSSTIVCAADQILYALDLRSPSQVGTYSLANDPVSIIPISNTKRFVVGPYYSPLTSDRKWLLDVCDLHSINAIANWPAGFDTAIGKDCLYETKLNRASIARRSLTDGSDLSDLELTADVQAEFNPKNGDTIGVTGSLIFVERAGSYQYFDLESQRKLELHRSDLIPVGRRPYSSPILFYAFENFAIDIVAYDDVTDQVLWELSARSEFTIYERPSSDEIILGTDQYGVSVLVLNAKSGKVLRSFTPFRYFSWLLALTEIGFAFWCVMWLRESALTWIPTWLNVTLLSLVALTVFCSFQIALGIWPSDRTVPQSYCQGIFLGLTISSLAWFSFGRTRLGTRYLAVLAVVVLLILYARCLFPTNAYQARSLLTEILLLASAAFIAFTMLRIFGARFDSITEKPSTARVRPFNLLDLFVAASAVAVIVAVAKPIVAVDIPAVDTARLVAIVAFGVGSICMLATFLGSRILFIATCVITSAIYAAMIFESIFQFVTARPLFVDRSHLIWHWFRVSTTGLVTHFAICLAYRNASWRLGLLKWRKLPACVSVRSRSDSLKHRSF